MREAPFASRLLPRARTDQPPARNARSPASLLDHENIYSEHADRYAELVAAEDCAGRLLPAQEELAVLRGRALLEVGVGTGRITRLIAPLARELIGGEREPAMLALARGHLASLQNCTLKLGRFRRAAVAGAGWCRMAACDISLACVQRDQ